MKRQLNIFKWPKVKRFFYLCVRRLAVPDDENVTIFHYVLLAFQAEKPFVADSRIAAIVDEVFPVHNLGADEFGFEIGVNGAAGSRRSAVHRNSPCAHFRFTGGEE